MVSTDQLIKDLEEYTKAIEQTKNDLAKDEGILQSLNTQLEELTGSKDSDKSKEIIDQWKNEKDKLEKELSEGTQKMKEMYPL